MSVAGFGEIAERLRRSTVQVSSGGRGHGSGIIVQPGGLIVTNAHVAAASPVHVQLWDGSRLPADLSQRDVGRDLALLRIARSGLPAATLGDSDRLRVGELVIAVGNPLGFIGALTMGVIHGVARVPGLGPMKWIQADVQLAPGNSGGPLADAHGNVIGVNTMVAGGLGLAAPINNVARLLNGAPAPAPLGVVLRPVRIAANGKPRLGLMILEVAKPSAADEASLMPGDILVAVAGRALDALEDLERALEGAGERTVRLQFFRGDRANIRAVTVRLGVPRMVAA